MTTRIIVVGTQVGLNTQRVGPLRFSDGTDRTIRMAIIEGHMARVTGAGLFVEEGPYEVLIPAQQFLTLAESALAFLPPFIADDVHGDGEWPEIGD